MASAYTSLLGLALPVTGELSGTWGNTVNTEITALLDSAIAGTTTLSSDADVTLTTTTGAANTSRQAILLWTAGGTVTRNITAPAQSKIYTVINASSSTQSIVLRGAGPTTGVTIVKGESAVCAWNGSDFIKISNTAGGGTFTNLTVTGVADFADGTAALPSITNTGDTNTGIFFPAADTIAFSEGGVEAARFDSAGNLGIGTTSPATKLDVRGTINASDGTNGNIRAYVDGTASYLQSLNQAANAYRPLLLMGSTVLFANNGVTNATLDTNGNFGLGVTPSAWGAGTSVIDLATSGNAGAVSASGTLSIANNGFFNGTNWIYKNTSSALLYQLISNQHRWSIAPSGTAGNPITFTQAMTLDASGRLGIANTSPSVNLEIGADTSTVRALAVRYSSVPAYLSNSYDGTLGLSTLSANNYNTSNGSSSWSAFQNTGFGSSAIQLAVSTGGADIRFLTAAAANTNPTERARITSGGYFKASDDGVYAGSANTWHEFNQSANSLGLAVVADNASFTSSVVEISAARNTTNNSYYFLDCAVAGVAYRFRVADSGAIATAGSISLGTVTPATSGIGVQFPATQSASSDANTLDDYEEGTWTPTLGGTSTYTIQAGTYVKVGKVVTAWFDMAISAMGTGNTTGVISGLPFLSRSSSYPQGMAGSVGYYGDLNLNIIAIFLRVDNNSTGIQTSVSSAAAATVTDGPNIYKASSRITGNITYETN
jgi:hypothetical protein